MDVTGAHPSTVAEEIIQKLDRGSIRCTRRDELRWLTLDFMVSTALLLRLSIRYKSVHDAAFIDQVIFADMPEKGPLKKSKKRRI